MQIPKAPKTPPSDPSFDETNGNDLDKLIETRDAAEQIEVLKGELPCLDSSSSCVVQLQALAIKSNSALRELDRQIEAADTAVKSANVGNNNFFRQAQVLRPLIGTALLGPVGGIFGVIDQLAGNSRTDQTTAQSNAELQIRVAGFQRTKTEVAENLKLQVLNELIRFDEVRAEAELSTVISNRESARLKLVEIAYRLGEGNTAEFIALQNNADRNKASASAKRSAVRSQAEKVKRIVLSGEI